MSRRSRNHGSPSVALGHLALGPFGATGADDLGGFGLDQPGIDYGKVEIDGLGTLVNPIADEV